MPSWRGLITITQELAQFSSKPVVNFCVTYTTPAKTGLNLARGARWVKELKLAYLGEGNNVTHSLLLAATLGLTRGCMP